MEFNPLMEISNDPMYKFFLKEAYKAAHELSDDLSTKVGAVIFGEYEGKYRMFARGANHLKPEFRDLSKYEVLEKLQDREWKLNAMEHAEDAVIKVAKSYGIDTNGKYMAMPWVPCGPCKDKIIDAGITKLITHKDMVLKTPERWWDSTNEGLAGLRKAGIELIMYDGKIGEGIPSTFSYETWFP